MISLGCKNKKGEDIRRKRRRSANTDVRPGIMPGSRRLRVVRQHTVDWPMHPEALPAAPALGRSRPQLQNRRDSLIVTKVFILKRLP